MISKADITDNFRRAMHRPVTLKQPVRASERAVPALQTGRKVPMASERHNASIAVFIPCLPPTTTAQQKGAFAAKGGGVRFFKKKKTKQAEDLLLRVLAPHAPAHPCIGPLSLCVDFVFPWRKSEKKSVISKFSRYPNDKKPDCSNQIKLLEDCMTALGFWHDDGQISVLRVRKYWGDKPGIALVLVSANAEDKSGNTVSA